ncbi:MAG TPA: methyltransferase domain-containing protein [Gaiellaceae bacterium]|nr:methyltransferase domain-containing protein [Gaiellaceae bacterium]
MTIDLDAYREVSRETWGEVAAGWEARREWMADVTAPVADWLIDQLDPQPGQTILDIASGTGDLGFAVAGRAGRVLSTDFSPEMVEVARKNGERRGVANVEHRVLDAERMDLADESVDGVICRWGYMLMADPGAALRETRRVLRDGGRLAFAVWTPPDRNLWAAIPSMILVERGAVPPPDPGAPGIFALGDDTRIRALVDAAGFSEPLVEEIRFDFRYADFDDFWDAIVRLAGPIARVINAMTDADREAVRAEMAERIAGFKQDDGSYSVPASSWGISVER